MEPVYKIYSFEEITGGLQPLLPKKPIEIMELTDESSIDVLLFKSPRVDHTYTVLHLDIFRNISALPYPKHRLNNEELGLLFSFFKSNNVQEAGQKINSFIQAFSKRCSSKTEEFIPYSTFVTEIEPRLKQNILNFKKDIRIGAKMILEEVNVKEDKELGFSPKIKEITTVAEVIYTND